MDLSIFAYPESWISLITLIFLEIILGIDNLVFIAITSDRLPEDKQKLGRKIGLAGALISRCIFLCFASALVHMTNKLFYLPFGLGTSEPLGFSVRDLVLLFGGIYLIYKGISELRCVLSLEDVKEAEHENQGAPRKRIGLAQAVVTIMIMDIVFSIDSVITAVGLAEHLIIMIIAVIVAVIVMMVFIDAISNFINRHVEMKILALVFIAVIGVLLILDGLGINSGIEVLDMHFEKLMVYFAMVFAVVLEFIQMKYNKTYNEWVAEKNKAKLQDLQSQAEGYVHHMEKEAEKKNASRIGSAPSEDSDAANTIAL